MDRVRESPAFDQVPAELWLPASSKLVGPDFLLAVDGSILLSNIVSGHGGYYDGLRVHAEYDLWFPFDVGSVRSSSIDVVATWARQTDETLRVRLLLDDVAAAASRSVRLPRV